MKSLNRIGKKQGTDKYRHGFLPFYDKHFSSRRLDELRLLEIGILGGTSLRMWAEYFRNAAITGCDIEEDSFFTAERVECCLLDQSSREALTAWRDAHAEGFDIIIDDGSHFMHDQQITFALLFPLLKSGGYYVIEDLHTSLGRSEKCFEVYGLNRDMSNSTEAMLKGFVDSGKIASPHMERPEEAYLENNIAACDIFYSKGWSVTSMIRKRQ